MGGSVIDSRPSLERMADTCFSTVEDARSSPIRGFEDRGSNVHHHRECRSRCSLLAGSGCRDQRRVEVRARLQLREIRTPRPSRGSLWKEAAARRNHCVDHSVRCSVGRDSTSQGWRRSERLRTSKRSGLEVRPVGRSRLRHPVRALSPGLAVAQTHDARLWGGGSAFLRCPVRAQVRSVRPVSKVHQPAGPLARLRTPCRNGRRGVAVWLRWINLRS